MDLLKALKRTNLFKTAALSALGAALSVVFVLALLPIDASAVGTCPGAGDCSAVIGHISASVESTLTVEEISAVNFGNMKATACPVIAGPTAGTLGANYLILGDEGKITAAGCLTPMYGLNQTIAGLNTATNNFGTGGQSPGFYAITGAISGSNVYISFADVGGDIVDSCYGSQGNGGAAPTGGCPIGALTTYTHPKNFVTLNGAAETTGATATAFAVNEFTFETDDPTQTNGTSGYGPLSAATWDAADNSGNYVTLTGATTATLRVGAKLTPLLQPNPGKYVGSFYLMVSY